MVSKIKKQIFYVPYITNWRTLDFLIPEGRKWNGLSPFIQADI